MVFEDLKKDIKYIVACKGNNTQICAGDIFWINSTNNSLVIPAHRAVYELDAAIELINEIDRVIECN